MAEFLKGINIKDPKQGAPDFVIGALSFKVDEFIQTLKENSKNGWVNAKIKRSRDGKLYIEHDTWQPNVPDHTTRQNQQSSYNQNTDDSLDLPF